ncbi:MAG: hypothetical protein WKG00_18030 [Polyangiaceae bacterium]
MCWADTPNEAALQCDACQDGQVCAQRGPEQLVCVSPEVCEALWDLGAVTVCRYADKSAYDHQPLPNPSGDCPGGAASAGKICGGACGPCDVDGSSQPRRCTGRSPLHPYGVCAHETNFGGTGEPAAIPSCTIAADGAMLEPCATHGDITYCAVFDVPPTDLAAARRHGICLRTKVCLHVAAALPGGMTCYDDFGQQVAP